MIERHPAAHVIAMVLMLGGALLAAPSVHAAEESVPSDAEAEAAISEVTPAADDDGETVVDAAAAAVRLWPEMPAVDVAKQPYVLVRALRTVQDEVAAGSAEAHEHQRLLLKELGDQMRDLPAGVWDDVRNVRAAIFFVLSGGDPSVLKGAIGRTKTPLVERRVLKGALAYGEGRLIDALSMMHKLEARKLDSSLGGMVALIQGTLIGRKDVKKAIEFFDEARLLAPGTLIEESALRQEILLLAREGEVERFDLLAAQYTRRFPRSLFARNFRRQFFAGVARQNFKRSAEWISRTETELMKVPASERVGMYLAIAEEATKGGNIDIARFAAGKARDLSHPGSRQMARSALYEGAALVATDEFEAGLALLGEIDATRLGTADRELYAAAVAVAGSVGRWPAVAEVSDDEALPASVDRAQALLADVDTLLGGTTQ